MLAFGFGAQSFETNLGLHLEDKGGRRVVRSTWSIHLRCSLPLQSKRFARLSGGRAVDQIAGTALPKVDGSTHVSHSQCRD